MERDDTFGAADKEGMKEAAYYVNHIHSGWCVRFDFSCQRCRGVGAEVASSPAGQPPESRPACQSKIE